MPKKHLTSYVNAPLSSFHHHKIVHKNLLDNVVQRHDFCNDETKIKIWFQIYSLLLLLLDAGVCDLFFLFNILCDFMLRAYFLRKNKM